jgi:hypothetical protein
MNNNFYKYVCNIFLAGTKSQGKKSIRFQNKQYKASIRISNTTNNCKTQSYDDLYTNTITKRIMHEWKPQKGLLLVSPSGNTLQPKAKFSITSILYVKLFKN